MIGLWQQSVVVIATEIASLSLLDASASNARLLAYLALHGLASILAAVLGWIMMPSDLKQPRWAVLALLMSFHFFVPAVGVISMVLVIHLAVRFPSVIRAERYAEIREPVFLSSEKEKREQSDIRAGHARRILADPRMSVETKLRVLIALQDMRPKVAIPLLQGLLADPAEDIRLLAYSMMDAWEKDITQRIQNAQMQLEAVNARMAALPTQPAALEMDALTRETHDSLAPSEAQKSVLKVSAGLTKKRKAMAEQDMLVFISAQRKLAELYWEQVDSGLARGDLRHFSLQKAKEHCELALLQDAHQPGLWLLFTQILIELGQAPAAQRTALLARKAGAPDTAVLPQLARLAFDAGDFTQAQTWMRRSLRTGQLPHKIAQCARYWTGKSIDLKL